MNMSFYDPNIIDTTTSMSVTSNTASLAYIFDKDDNKQYSSSGQDTTTSKWQLDYNFAETSTLDTIIIKNCNWKKFTVFLNGTTATTFTLLGNITTASDWVTNSLTNLFLRFATITNASKVSFLVSETQGDSAGSGYEKKVGQIWLLNRVHTLEKNPPASGYKPAIIRKQIEHEMADGGISIMVLAEKYRADIDMSYCTTTETTSLKDIWDNQPFVFMPQPTGTAWAGLVYECVWTGDFGFIEPSKDDYSDHGWKGSIKLRETAK